MRISMILDRIDERQLFVPAFQREYVWKQEDAKKLLGSLINDYPTGTMLTWDTNHPPELKGSHKYDPRQGAVKILLDGQQRITTLYMLIRGAIPPYYTAAEITHDTRGLYVNVETSQLEYYSRQKMEADPRWQNITDIFQKKILPSDIVDNLEKRGELVDRDGQRRIAEGLRTIELILDREFPEQIIPPKATISEAIDIFYLVNASGVALTEAELALAQISGYWPQARDTFKKKLAQLAEAGFVFKLDFIVYVLLGCLYHLGSDMKKLHSPDNDQKIREAWTRLDSQVLDYVVNMMRSSAYVDHTDEINSVYALVPIIVYCFDKNGANLTADEIQKAVKWFFYSQVRTRYVSQLQQKLDRDLRLVAQSSSPFDDLLKVIAEEERPLEIVPGEFEGRGITHPLFSLMRWYFKSRKAICFKNGAEIRRTMGKKYQLENDHIFPYSLLKKAGYGKENRVKYALAQEITNRAIITLDANRTKSDKAPEIYLPSVQKSFPTALDLQSIPTDSELWKMDNYELFLAARRKMLAKSLNEFLAEIAVTGDTVRAASLEDLLAEGETDDLEFKSSLRWDYQQQMSNKKLEEVIIKSVAAFANGQGGTLLIGVDDQGKPLGLERDYAALGNVDRDKFEIHLRNVLNNAFGPNFVTTRLKITFPLVAEVEICQIEVTPALNSIFVKLTDKNGVTAEKFYVRSGNSSQEMSPSETQSYIAERFS